MDRILTILRVLDHSKNAIFLISTEAVTANGGNDKARKLFGLGTNPVSVESILGSEFSNEGFMEKVIPSLMETEKCLIENAPVTSVAGEAVPCDLDFVLASDDMEYIFLIIRIKEDRRGHYIENLLLKSKEPTFILDYTDELLVRDGNDLFYQSFACSKEDIGDKYEHLFANFLAEETKEEDVQKILEAIPDNSSGILEIPIQTAHGDILFLYYNSKKLKPLVNENERCLYCKLIEQEVTLHKVEYPYDKNHRD